MKNGKAAEKSPTWWEQQLSMAKVQAVLQHDDGFRNVVRARCVPKLTERQMAVAKLLAAEKTFAQIAADLGMTVRAVQFHVSRAASRIPGTGLPKLRLAYWYRGASLQLLMGSPPERPGASVSTTREV